MRTLYRAIGAKEVGGEPLPAAFKTLQANEIVFRRAELNLVAGTPGAGKSSIALAIAVQAQVPTLYVSADTNAHTMGMRVYSMATGVSQAQSENILKFEKDSFDSSPTLSDIDESVQAFETVWGCSPTLIVVDNLMDIAMDGMEEFSGMRAAMKELKYLARDTNACVLILHHTKESFDATPCQPRSAVQGMVNQIPALILTIGQQEVGDRNYLCVSAVKNRYGRADSTGRTFTMLSFDPACMQLKDVTTGE
jgi:predicted ATP-dependent serine protease